jgi:hypothetical protein
MMGSPLASYDKKGGSMTRPRAADDFAVIRARMEELRRERTRVPAEQKSRATIDLGTIITPQAAEAAQGRRLLLRSIMRGGRIG